MFVSAKISGNNRRTKKHYLLGNSAGDLFGMVSENVTRNQWLFKRPTTRGFFKGQGLNHLVAILYAVTHLAPSLTPAKSWITFRSGKCGACRAHQKVGKNCLWWVKNISFRKIDDCHFAGAPRNPGDPTQTENRFDNNELFASIFVLVFLVWRVLHSFSGFPVTGNASSMHQFLIIGQCTSFWSGEVPFVAQCQQVTRCCCWSMTFLGRFGVTSLTEDWKQCDESTPRCLEFLAPVTSLTKKNPENERNMESTKITLLPTLHFWVQSELSVVY